MWGYWPLKNLFGNFYFEDFDIGKFNELSFVIPLILTLNLGQSAVERSFSLRDILEQ